MLQKRQIDHTSYREQKVSQVQYLNGEFFSSNKKHLNSGRLNFQKNLVLDRKKTWRDIKNEERQISHRSVNRRDLFLILHAKSIFLAKKTAKI